MLWALIRIASKRQFFEAILMSTHNICFYGELSKNYALIIINYPPYLFYCNQQKIRLSSCWSRYNKMAKKKIAIHITLIQVLIYKFM